MASEARHLVHRVPDSLRPYVAAAHGYAAPPMPSGVHRGLPSRHLTLVVEIPAPLAVTGPGYAVADHGVVGGLHVGPAMIDAGRPQEGLQYSLTPLGTSALLGVPAGELSGQTVPLRDVLGARATEAIDRVVGARGWRQRFEALDAVLAAGLDRDRGRVPAEVVAAWQMIVRVESAAPVSEVAEAVGWSRRHLLTRFREAIGVTPKQAHRIARFEAVRHELVARRGLAVAGVAAGHGYADQQHLAREWRALAGCSLGTWLREEFPFVHDTEVPMSSS